MTNSDLFVCFVFYGFVLVLELLTGKEKVSKVGCSLQSDTTTCLGRFLQSQAFHICNTFLSNTVILNGSGLVKGDWGDEDIKKHVSVGRVEGSGRNPPTSKLGIRKSSAKS